MALVTEPTYSTLEDFQAHTLVTSQKTIDEEAWTPYALYAEEMIDEYIGFIQKYDSTQVRKFPTVDSEGNSKIPEDLQMAHIRLTSHLILKGEPTTEDFLVVQREAWSATGYSKEFKDSHLDSASVGLPPLVLKTLRKYGGYTAPLTY